MKASYLIVLTAFTAALLEPGLIFADCVSSMEIRSRHVRFQYQDVRPLPEKSDSEKASQLDSQVADMWDRMASGVALAVSWERRVERDSILARMLVGASLCLTSSAGGPIQPAASQSPAPSDSLITLFSSLARDPMTDLYTVLLGSFRETSSANSLMERLGDLRKERYREAWDSTLAFDMAHTDCLAKGTGRPVLAVLPARTAGNRNVWVLSGLYYSYDDARRAAERIRRTWNIDGRAAPIRLSGALLRYAFPAD